MMDIDIEIHVTQDRLEETITVGQLLEIESGNLKAIVGAMANFVVGDDGKYLNRDEGQKVIESLTIKEMKELAGTFTQKITDTAVPPENVSGS